MWRLWFEFRAIFLPGLVACPRPVASFPYGMILEPEDKRDRDVLNRFMASSMYRALCIAAMLVPITISLMLLLKYPTHHTPMAVRFIAAFLPLTFPLHVHHERMFSCSLFHQGGGFDPKYFISAYGVFN